MSLETRLSNMIARLLQGRFRPVCHPERSERISHAKPPRRREYRFPPSAFIPHPFRTGWLVATNLNTILETTIIKPATEVAGLSFGKDVIVAF